MTALVWIPCVALVCGSALLGLRMVLDFRRTKLEHAPLTELQSRMAALEAQILRSAMRR